MYTALRAVVIVNNVQKVPGQEKHTVYQSLLSELISLVTTHIAQRDTAFRQLHVSISVSNSDLTTN
jgi:hemerythrin